MISLQRLKSPEVKGRDLRQLQKKGDGGCW